MSSNLEMVSELDVTMHCSTSQQKYFYKKLFLMVKLKNFYVVTLTKLKFKIKLYIYIL